MMNGGTDNFGAAQYTDRHSNFNLEDKLLNLMGKGKGKAIPLQPLTGPEGSRRLRLLNFKTIGT
jgi:hypothetical protein